jgi:predicted esterase
MKPNNHLILFLHGSRGTPTHLRNDPITAGLINTLQENGFTVITPAADMSKHTASKYWPRWTSENDDNGDVKLLKRFINDAAYIIYPNFWQRIKNKLFGPSIKVSIIGGSSGGIMASRMAQCYGHKLHKIVMVNGLHCDSIALVNDQIIIDNSRINIADRHPITMLINSTIDDLFPLASKIAYANALGDKAHRRTCAEGTHNWGKWTEIYHNHILWFLQS